MAELYSLTFGTSMEIISSILYRSFLVAGDLPRAASPHCIFIELEIGDRLDLVATRLNICLKAWRLDLKLLFLISQVFCKRGE